MPTFRCNREAAQAVVVPYTGMEQPILNIQDALAADDRIKKKIIKKRWTKKFGKKKGEIALVTNALNIVVA